jgi:hypothetical protein
MLLQKQANFAKLITDKYKNDKHSSLFVKNASLKRKTVTTMTTGAIAIFNAPRKARIFC